MCEDGPGEIRSTPTRYNIGMKSISNAMRFIFHAKAVLKWPWHVQVCKTSSNVIGKSRVYIVNTENKQGEK